jgi:hypothetical protein
MCIRRDQTSPIASSVRHFVKFVVEDAFYESRKTFVVEKGQLGTLRNWQFEL